MVALADQSACGAPPGELPPEVPLWVYRGDTRAWRLRLWADKDRTEPFDLAGVLDVTAQVRRDPDRAAATELRCDVTLPNVVTLHLSAAASAVCPSGRWDMQARWPDGRVATLARGPIHVEPDVTRHD
jgi:hypothetical protein